MKEKKKIIFYELNPKFFKDSNHNGIGDINGLIQKIDYFKYLNIDAIILQDALSSDSNDSEKTFTNVDRKIGDVNSIIKLLSVAKNRGIEIFLEFNIGSITEEHRWFKSAANGSEQFEEVIDFKNSEGFKTQEINFNFNEEKMMYYPKDVKTQEIPLNWRNNKIEELFLKAFKFWIDQGITGFIFKKFEYLKDPTRLYPLNKETLKTLRSFYLKVRQLNSDVTIIGKSDLWFSEEYNFFTNEKTKVFDYYYSTHISMIGISKRFGIDKVGSFNHKKLSKEIRRYANNENHILALNSYRVGKVISRWLNDRSYIRESAKLLILVLFLAKSSPLIYQGDELGVPNLGLTYLDDFQTPDLDERKSNAFRNRIDDDDFMEAQVRNNPINARSLMPWDDRKNGSFSFSIDLITPLSDGYEEINVKHQFENKNSVLHFTKLMMGIIRDPKYKNIITDGTYKVRSYMPGIIQYTITYKDKSLWVFLNVTDATRIIIKPQKGKVIASTYFNKNYDILPSKLSPYEGIVISSMSKEYMIKTKKNAIQKIKDEKRETKLIALEEKKSIKEEKIAKQNEIKVRLEKEKEENKKEQEERQKEVEKENKHVEDAARKSEEEKQKFEDEEKAKKETLEEKKRLENEKAKEEELELKKELKLDKEKATQEAKEEAKNLKQEKRKHKAAKKEEKKIAKEKAKAAKEKAREEVRVKNEKEQIERQKLKDKERIEKEKEQARIIKQREEKKLNTSQSNTKIIKNTKTTKLVNTKTMKNTKTTKLVDTKNSKKITADSSTKNTVLKKVKAEAINKRNIELSSIEGKTKLKNEEIAKTTLLKENDPRLKDLFDTKNSKMKKKKK